MEAASHAKIRRVRLGRGERHADVEKLISEAKSTSDKVTLAVLDDPAQGLGAAADGARGSAAPAAWTPCSAAGRAPTTGSDGDLRPFVKDVERLADWIQQ